MTVETLERPETIRLRPARGRRPARETQPTDFEPNFGPEDLHAIKAIAYIMNGIFGVALLMYGTMAVFAWLAI
jgi:hypothetical protein